MSQTFIQDHVDLIAKHEQEFLAKRTRLECFSDDVATFVGSFTFVFAHVLVFGAWILTNTLHSTRFHRFDPAPFSLLSTLVGMEAILLVSFVLMRQSRISRRTEERDHLMLQVLLLTEKEVTMLLRMERHSSDKVGFEEIANSKEAKDLSKTLSIENVAQRIREHLQTE